MQPPVRNNNAPLVTYANFSRPRWYQGRGWVLPATIALAILLVGAVSALPLWRAWKTWRARRLAAAATALIQANDFPKAYTYIQQADHYGPDDAEVQRTKGHFLTRARAYPQAIAVWEKLLRGQNTLTPNDRLDYATAAYELDRLPLAAEQLRLLHEQLPVGTPAESLLAARLSERFGDRPGAVKNASEVLASPRATPPERYDAALLLLNDAEDPAVRKTAWETIDQLAEANDSTSLQSLAFLASQNLVPTVNTQGKTGLANDVPALIQRLETHPLSNPGVKLGVVELRYKQNPSRGQALIDQAVAQYKDSPDDNTVLALCRWLLAHQGAAEVVKILPLERAMKNRSLLAVRMDALASTAEWGIIEKELGDPAVSGKLEDILPPLFLARSSVRLGKPVAAEVNWDRALSLAGTDRRKLLTVAAVAESEHQSDRAEAAYRAVVAAAPADPAAYPPLLRFLTEHGGAAAVYPVLLAMAKQWPDDASLQVSIAYTGMLASTVPPAEGRAAMEALLAKNPSLASARAALALALLQSNHPADALAALGEPFDPGPPAAAQPALVVHAAALGANGQVEAAKSATALLLDNHKLLPEERTLLTPYLPKVQG